MSQEYEQSTDYLQSLATSAMSKVHETKGNILQLFGAFARVDSDTVSFDFDLDKPNVAGPPSFADLLKGDSTVDAEVLRLNDEIEAWVNTYFPAISGGLRTIPDDWLVNVISGVTPFGIESTIFDLVWQRARDRAWKQAQSSAKTLSANMSARGFSIPNGALVDLNMELYAKVDDATAEVNRDQAIKDAEIKHELLKFAEEQAIKYKLGMMSAMVDLMKVFAVIPNNDIERDRIRASAMSAYYNALSQYYNIEVAFEELRLKAESTRAEVELKNAGNELEGARIKVSGNTGLAALGDAAQAFGTIAASAAAGASSLVAQIESL